MIPVIDGHNDALLRVWRRGGWLLERSEDGHVDLPRMREGGIAAGFFAVFVAMEGRCRSSAPSGSRTSSSQSPSES